MPLQDLILQEADELKKRVRAKYVILPDGQRKLVCVQSFDKPFFLPSGWELDSRSGDVPDFLGEDPDEDPDECSADFSAANIKRASRRAKINAFDIILSNPDLDTFATFTYRPDDALDKSSYDQCFRKLSPWLSNRVQRKGLKYVVVPERHKSGDIHFHGIMNSSALKLETARNPRSGRAIRKNGKVVLNITDWAHGFTTAQIIGGADVDREKVAKYIFKYMGKQMGTKIGGRYALIGGNNLSKPVYEYSDTVSEFLPDAPPTYEKSVTIGDDLQFTEYSFV